MNSTIDTDCLNHTIGMLEAIRGRMMSMKIDPDAFPEVIEILEKMITAYDADNESTFNAAWMRMMNLRHFVQKAQEK